MDRRLKLNWAPFGNFGDALNPYFLHKLNIPFIFAHHAVEHKVCMIGSILSIGSKKNSVMWGNGFMYESENVKPGTILKAVRGPESLKKVEKSGYNINDIAIGDPALLLPRIYNPSVEKKYKLGIIPHIMDFQLYMDYVNENREKFENTLLIDPNLMCGQVESFINKVLQCEKIVATCLHGLICADAYGIPSVWSEISNRLVGDGIKFKDYYGSIGIDSISKIGLVEDENITIDSKELNIDLDRLWNCRPWQDLSDDYYVDISNIEEWKRECYPPDYSFQGRDLLWGDKEIKCNL